MKSYVTKSSFGRTPDGQNVHLFTLTNRTGAFAKITSYGATITELHVPDRHGRLGNVVLGFDNLKQYLAEHPYFGATIGRVANRTARGRFSLEGKKYRLAVNNGPNHLHGGLKGFDKLVWSSEIIPGLEASVKFSLLSPHMDEGYPGNLTTEVVMTFTHENELHLEYAATTDRATPVNLTNHSYFNLAGGGNVLNHEIKIAARRYTPVDATQIPTGKILPVKGTPFDFISSRQIGLRFKELQSTETPIGYDHNFVLDHGSKRLGPCATVFEPTSGRIMTVRTTQPGVQFYTGNFLDGTLAGNGGGYYTQHTGFCLETQHFPDSVNHPKFPSTILCPGQVFHHKTVYAFSTRRT